MLLQQKLTDEVNVEDARQQLDLASRWWQANWDILLDGAIRIVIILVIALVVRYLLHRAIDRVTRGDGTALPAVLKPLRERAPESLGGLVSERRVQRARTLGFSIEDCRQLMALYQDRGRASADVRQIAAAHVRVIEEKVRELQAMRATLQKLVHDCHGDERPDCPILEEMAGAAAIA